MIVSLESRWQLMCDRRCFSYSIFTCPHFSPIWILKTFKHRFISRLSFELNFRGYRLSELVSRALVTPVSMFKHVLSKYLSDNKFHWTYLCTWKLLWAQGSLRVRCLWRIYPWSSLWSQLTSAERARDVSSTGRSIKLLHLKNYETF